MEHPTLEIFGNENTTVTSKVRKGCHLTANRKNKNAYLSNDAKELIFGKNAKHGFMLVINSKIENNWYLAKSQEQGKGFECKINDIHTDASMRINGIQKLIDKIAESHGHKDERIVFEVSEKSIAYEGLKLHKLSIINI